MFDRDVHSLISTIARAGAADSPANAISLLLHTAFFILNSLQLLVGSEPISPFWARDSSAMWAL